MILQYYTVLQKYIYRYLDNILCIGRCNHLVYIYIHELKIRIIHTFNTILEFHQWTSTIFTIILLNAYTAIPVLVTAMPLRYTSSLPMSSNYSLAMLFNGNAGGVTTDMYMFIMKICFMLLFLCFTFKSILSVTVFYLWLNAICSRYKTLGRFFWFTEVYLKIW